jgi:flagellar hook protein FlgE
MSQSLYTAMGGISAAQTDLNVVSNNIANLNTTGYKSSSVNFSDVYYTTLSSGTGTSQTTGGTNPMQVGIGVQVSAISKDFSSGTWVATGKTTDLMIQGGGFFTAMSPAGEVF